MKVSDICVGDWLNIYNFPNDNPRQDDLFPAKLSAVFIFEPFKEPDVADVELVFKNKEGGNAIASRPLDTCLPIELTEEILVKNGFRIQKTHDNGKWLWVTDNSWLAYSERHNYWYYEDIKVTYVHQLQHLLRLAGVQKEIEL